VLATGRGLLSVVDVLGALYPAMTVLLARVVLHERLTRAQDAGVLVTLAGVVALAAGA
jgi:drug/metabolite transporter (DMT)-like permease